MARSKEALLRRAEKRGRTVQEQRIAEIQSMRKADQTQKDDNERIIRVKEEPDAYRNKTSSRGKGRPAASTVALDKNRGHGNIPLRAVEVEKKTKPTLHWAEQASSDQIAANQELRERYHAGDTSLSAEQIERARVLLARDERKKQKKATGRNKANGNNKDDLKATTRPTAVVTAATKSQTKRNKAIRKRFAKTGGKGMSEDDIARYHQLKKRDERKKAEKEQRVAAAMERKRKRKTEGATHKEELTKDQRKALRKQYKKTRGEGMSKQDIQLAKTLIEQKKEKKKRRRTT